MWMLSEELCSTAVSRYDEEVALCRASSTCSAVDIREGRHGRPGLFGAFERQSG